MLYMNSGGRRGRSSGGGGKCLICFGEIKRKPVLKLPKEFGTKTVDAFLKICELLKVSFLEIQEDWEFGDMTSTDKLPFCSGCFTGFHTILKLQTQLVELQKKIDEKINEIIGKIQESTSEAGAAGDLKAIAFRQKALCHVADNYSVSSTSTTYNNAPYAISTRTTPSSSTRSSQQHLSTTATSSSQISSQEPQYIAIITQNNGIQINTNATNTPVYSSAPKKEIPSTNPSQDYSQSYAPSNDDAAPASLDGDEGQNFSDFSNPESSNDEEEDPKAPGPPTKRRKYTYNKYERDDAKLAALFPEVPAHKKSQKRERQPEYFSPVETDRNGQMIFEGIMIIPAKSGYKCGQCGVIVGKKHDTLSLRKAKIHIKGVHLNAYKCTLCGKNFSSNDILSQHTYRIHDIGENPCPTCGKPIRERNMRQHLFTHMNAQEQDAAIAAGFKKYCFKREPDIPCRICGKLLMTPGKLRRHELSHISPVFRKDYKCPHCDKAYTTRQAQKDHISSVHEHLNAKRTLCKICGEGVIAKNLPKHMATHGIWTCKHCEKVYKTEFNHQKHEEKCGKPKEKREGYDCECDICNKFFPSIRYLQIHRQNVHKSHWKLKVPATMINAVSVDNPKEECLDDLNNEGIQHVEGHVYSYQLYNLEKLEEGGDGGIGYRCCTCSEEIREEEDEDALEEKVKEHVRSMHMGNFRCNWCTKRMKSLFEAEVHQRKEHSNMLLYDCDVCGRTAISSNLIRKHVWEHKNVWEMADSINAGEGGVPRKFPTSDMYEALRSLGVEVNLKCRVCEKTGFDTLEGLYQHRCEEHPDAPQLKVKRLKNQKKRGPKGPRKRRRGGFGSPKRERVNGKARPSGRRVKVVAEEDSESEDMEFWDEGQVEIKEEVVSGGEEETSDSEEELQEIKEIEKSSGGKRRSQPTRTSSRRRSAKKANYAEDNDSDEDLNIKGSPQSSEMEEWAYDS